MRNWFCGVACCLSALLPAGCGGSSVATLPAVHVREAEAVALAPVRSEYFAQKLPPTFVPSAIMKDGTVPGSANGVAALYRHGAIELLGTFQGRQSVALFANPRGDAVGYAVSADQVYSTALLFASGRIFDLGHLPDPPGTLLVNRHIVNKALVIDERGTIYGFSDFPDDLGGSPLVRYFVSAPPARVTAGGLGVGGTIGNINARGQFAVEQVISPPIGPYAGVGAGLTVTSLFGQRASAATWINDAGAVTGYVDPVNEQENDFNRWNGFIEIGRSVTMIPALPGYNSTMPFGLNDRGETVGTSGCAGSICNDTVFVYRKGRVADLRALLPGKFGTAVDALPGISERGEFLVRSASNYYVIEPKRP